MKGRPFALIGVSSDAPDRAGAAVADNGINRRSFQDAPEGATSKISEDWLLNSWPTIVVLDADFRIRYRGMDADVATEIARDLVNELEHDED